MSIGGAFARCNSNRCRASRWKPTEQAGLVQRITNYTYNAVNQVTGQSGFEGTKTFTYDLAGNMTGDGTRTFQWDAENRLAKITQGTRTSEFTYDGMGRRYRIVEKDGATTLSDTRHLWCGRAVCEERDGATGNTPSKRFFSGGFQQGATNYYYTRDHLGSVREVLDTTGAVAAKYSYDAWGRQTKVSGTIDADFGYAGYWTHRLSGLYLTWYRAYDPQIGRWLQQDASFIQKQF